MFLESCGKLFFSKMRPPLFYALLFAPLLLAGGYLLMEYSSLQELESQFLQAAQKEKGAAIRKKRKERFLNRYFDADPFFLDKEIESQLFLQDEASRIKALISHPAIANKRGFQERLDFLTGKKNRLSFVEEQIRTTSKMKETDEKQRDPVQMSKRDLEILLSSIEDIPIGENTSPEKRPQLIVRDFRIKKLKTLFSEVFEVEMDLLKREWTKHES